MFSTDPTMRWFYLIFILSVCRAAEDFRICSYNVQNFNMQKASNYKLIHTLTRVVSRCDVCLLQHVVDVDGRAVNKLLAVLNRTEMVNLTGQHQYSSKQSFVREPFVVQFQSNRTAIKKFVLVPLHSEPSKAVHEIDRLYDVFQEVSKKWNNKNVMFLGDFHASCAYVTRKDRKKIRLFKNSNFSWLIGDKVDTTVTDDTNCAYDRIVVHGEPFLKAIKPFSAQVYNFGKDLKLPQTRVLEVSDHFPIEVRLKGPASTEVRVKGSAPFLIQATPLLLLLLSVIGQFVL
uniref:Deoxyribonuclease n=1 Tax=Amphiprion ocellaris TaxID=80972 RepID=A0A3Q1C3I3_AMPOC